MKNQGKEEHSDKQQIVSKFYDKILGYVIKNIKDIEVAKDITQEVMGRMIDAYDNNVSFKNIKAWLFQVTRNLITDHFRKKDLHNYVETDMDSRQEADQEFDITAEDFIIPMIKLLPEEYSTPLYLSDIENLKQADIAKKLNISLSAAKMRCQRARKMLHNLFLECCDIHYTEDGSFASCTIKLSCDILLEEEKKFKNKLGPL